MSRSISFEDARGRYVHRFTMEHVPAWSQRRPCDAGGLSTRYYAPQYASDQEWYDKTIFPREPGHFGARNDCYSSNASWPLGQWLDAPFHKGMKK